MGYLHITDDEKTQYHTHSSWMSPENKSAMEAIIAKHNSTFRGAQFLSNSLNPSRLQSLRSLHPYPTPPKTSPLQKGRCRAPPPRSHPLRCTQSSPVLTII